LLKRYLVESGSTWVRSWIEPSAGNVIVICDLTPIEVFSSFQRRQRDGTLAPANTIALQRDFLAHLQQEYLSVQLNAEVVVLGRSLVTRHILRPPDALQLASALHFVNLLAEPINFICADIGLLAAGNVEGLVTDNPSNYP
jgi:predicted nucleic acid-binding protein